MFVLEEPTSRKRQRISLEPATDDQSPVTKRQRSSPGEEARSGRELPSFWDTLSKIRLSRGALREFDRRNDQTECSPSLLPEPTTTSLPKQDLHKIKRFAQHGGPNLAHLRGVCSSCIQWYECMRLTGCDFQYSNLPIPVGDAMSQPSSRSRKRSSTSNQSGTTKTSKSCSAYSSNFELKLIDHGIYPKGYEFEDNRTPPPPANLEDIRRRLTQPRLSLSPSQFSESDFNNFERHNDRAQTEWKAMTKVVPIIAGDSDDRHPSEADVPFGHLEPMSKDIVKPKPDIYYGAKPEQIDRRVRDELGKYIVPSSDTSLPAVPNCFLEGKSAKGRADVARRQACYDGAVGARAMHQLQNYGASPPVYDGNAYTITNIYHDGLLMMYATHPAEPKVPGGQPQYHMTQLKGYAMTGDVETFRKGAAAFRNGRDWAKEQRDRFIADANGTAQRRSVEPSSSTVKNSSTSSSTAAEAEFTDSDTSADELALDNDLTSKRPRRASPANQNRYQPSIGRDRHG